MTIANAPIALFVYNRPEHTRRTLEALERNEGANRSKLFIFSDGLRDGAGQEDFQRWEQVRKLIRREPWCGEIEIFESDVNKGLSRSIRSGVDAVLRSHDSVIVLEDDLETSPGFLKYMNESLELYRDEGRVFQISGFMVKNWPWVPSTGFLRVSTSWGWGTWRRAWAHYRDDADKLLAEIERKGKTQFDLDGYSFHFEELNRNVTGELATWAVRWYASIFLNDGLCLYPRRTMVRNLGFDGTGEHCNDDETNYHRSLKLAGRTEVFRQELIENPHYLKAIQSHYRQTLQLWTRTRFRDRLRRKVLRALKVEK